MFDVLFQDRERRTAHRSSEIAWRPKNAATFPNRPKRHDARKLLFKTPARYAFQAIHQFRQAHLRRIIDQQMHVVTFAVELLQFDIEVGTNRSEDFLKPVEVFIGQHLAAPLGRENQVSVQHKNNVTACSEFHRLT